MTNPLSFIHISDTHIGPTPQFKLREVDTYSRTERLVRAIETLPFTPSFVIHTGDVVADPDRSSYELAAQLFGRIKVPVRYVAGNHDSSSQLRSALPSAAIERLNEDRDSLSYAFSHGHHRFITLDATVSPPFWGANLSGAQLAFLDAEIAKAPSSLTVFLHYPTISFGVPWIEEKMMLFNGQELHRRLSALPRGTVRGVFSGHVHRSVSVVQDGILYQSGPSSATQFESWPSSTDITFAKTPSPAFSLVTLTESATVVQHHELPD